MKTLTQQQQHRFRKSPDIERLRPIHGNLDKRAIEALKYLVEVFNTLSTFDMCAYVSNELFFSIGSPKQCNPSSNGSISTSK